jgi:hypothetical protein
LALTDVESQQTPPIVSVVMGSRSQIRTTVAAVVIVLIAGALIFETPGTVGIAGMLVVLAAMVLLIVQERRRHSRQ